MKNRPAAERFNLTIFFSTSSYSFIFDLNPGIWNSPPQFVSSMSIEKEYEGLSKFSGSHRLCSVRIGIIARRIDKLNYVYHNIISKRRISRGWIKIRLLIKFQAVQNPLTIIENSWEKNSDVWWRIEKRYFHSLSWECRMTVTKWSFDLP